MADEQEALRNLMHDLRSPLAVVDGLATLLAREDLDAAKRAQYVEQIRQAAAEMRSLLDAALPPK